MISFSSEEQKIIARYRNTEMFKVDDVSDIRSVRRCYLAAKQLYECLRYFDSRYSRFQTFTSFQNKSYCVRRSFYHPDDFYCFLFFDTRIEIRKSASRGNQFCIVSNFPSKTFPVVQDLCSQDSLVYNLTPHFSEAKEVFLKLISEFICARFDDRGLF